MLLHHPQNVLSLRHEGLLGLRPETQWALHIRSLEIVVSVVEHFWSHCFVSPSLGFDWWRVRQLLLSEDERVH